MELAAASSGGGGPAAWITILVTGIAAAAAIIAAIVAAASARSTKQLELQAQRTRELESRISERKAEVYEPMIVLLGNVIGGEARGVQPTSEQVVEKVAEFTTWISIYGSDDAIKAFHNFTQAAFNQAPGLISSRLYAEFIIAARRDLGYPDTSVTAAQIMGMRITDLYSESDYRLAMSQSFDELYRHEGWVPPWLTAMPSRQSLPTDHSSPSS
jgi:hypothetical protein